MSSNFEICHLKEKEVIRDRTLYLLNSWSQLIQLIKHCPLIGYLISNCALFGLMNFKSGTHSPSNKKQTKKTPKWVLIELHLLQITNYGIFYNCSDPPYIGKKGHGFSFPIKDWHFKCEKLWVGGGGSGSGLFPMDFEF